MDKLQLTGQNLGRVFSSKRHFSIGHCRITHASFRALKFKQTFNSKISVEAVKKWNNHKKTS
jgi:hypothetical protein